MGIFSKLRSPRPTMVVTVSPQRVRPGDSVTITVNVSGEIGPKYDRFEFGLLGGGTWMTTANLPGNNIHTQQFFNWSDDRRELPLATGTTTATFTIPSDAPGTCKGYSTNLMAWNAISRGDGGRYLHATAEVVVEVTPDACAAREDLPPEDFDPSPAVAVRLEIGRRVVAGGLVSGELVVTGLTGATIEGVDLRTQAWAVTADDERLDPDPGAPFPKEGDGVFTHLVEQIKGSVPGAEGAVVPAGDERRFPVAIALPSATFTTLATRRVRGHVLVTARVHLAEGGKPWTRVELNVPTAPA